MSGEVVVRVPAALRELVDGASSVSVDAGVLDAGDGEATSIARLLDVLGTRYPALERRVRDEQGRLRTHVNLFVGPDNIRDLDGLATPVRPGQELSIIPAVSGG